MKQVTLLICFLHFALIGLPMAVAEEATPQPKVQEQTAQERKSEEAKSEEVKSEETKSEETKRLKVSTEKNMVKKPGNLAVGLGVKRKGILLLPVVVLKAKRPSLQDQDVVGEGQPKP